MTVVQAKNREEAIALALDLAMNGVRIMLFKYVITADAPRGTIIAAALRLGFVPNDLEFLPDSGNAAVSK